ncbi:MAG: hypothetical protein KDI98_01900 [Hyphomicrobiaceae bacterium]|nr:hypothetical protein [Hyphomicrobiaceae bacterium]
MIARFTALSSFLALFLAGCAATGGGEPVSWYGFNDFPPPRGEQMVICHGFGCALRTPVTVSPADRSRLAAILAEGHATPAAEREAIGRAVRWFETRIGPSVGSVNDIGGLDLQNAGVRGQMDCIDESTNTLSLLLYLDRIGALRHHTVGRPVARGFFLDGRYPHATAVVAEKEGGARFAVDPWPYGNGAGVDIMPLERWFAIHPLG